MTTNNSHNQFESLLRNMREDFSLSQSDKVNLRAQFNAKLAAHKVSRARTKSPFFFSLLSQRMVAAAFSVMLVLGGVFLNYLNTFDTTLTYQTAMIQNNVALLVKNPLAFGPEMKSSLLSAHTAYANSIEERAIQKPEETLVSNTAILGLYESAFSMLVGDKNTTSEILNFMQGLINDATKRNHEYEEQLAITALVEPTHKARDYSQIITAISNTLNESEAILKEHPELNTHSVRTKLNTLHEELRNISDTNIHEIKHILKESTDLYELLSLTSVL